LSFRGDCIQHGFDPDGKSINIITADSLKLAGTAITASAAEINALADTGLSDTELGFLDGVTAGTATASKALVLGASKEIATITTLTSTTINGTNVDAGASGTAGTVDVFPTTASKGKVAITAADSAGDTTTTIVNASQAGARTYTIPDAGASASFLMTQGAQTVAGAQTFSAASTLTAGAAAAAVALRLGASATEGLEIKVIDEVVTTTNGVEDNLTETVPAGAVILYGQINLDTAVVGDASGDDLLAKVGLGTTADPDKYGKTAALTLDSKGDLIVDWAVLGSEETVAVRACKTDGTACTEKFTGSESVRVRLAYLVLNSLDNV